MKLMSQLYTLESLWLVLCVYNIYLFLWDTLENFQCLRDIYKLNFFFLLFLFFRSLLLLKEKLIGKDSDAGRDWGQEEKGTTGWDGWMASLTRWTWVWVNSGSWWWTGRPGVLRFMRSQRVGHDWATELNWTELKEKKIVYYCYLVTD